MVTNVYRVDGQYAAEATPMPRSGQSYALVISWDLNSFVGVAGEQRFHIAKPTAVSAVGKNTTAINIGSCNQVLEI